MPKSNEEKILNSIDGTLKDILKELKKANRATETTIKVDAPLDKEMLAVTSKALKNWNAAQRT